MKRIVLVVLTVTTFIAVGCGTTPTPTPTSQLVLPTPPTATVPALPTAEPTATNAPTVAPPASPTALPVLPTPTATSLPAPTATSLPAPTATLPPAITATPGPVTYRVVFVEPDDALNVRDGAGVDHDVVLTLAPGAAGIRRDSRDESIVSGSRWVKIEHGGEDGWVNDLFLTEDVSPEEFCRDPAAREALDAFIRQVEGRDGRALAAASLETQRGLRIRHDWWNNEVRLSGAALPSLFTSATTHDWGTEMGSGAPLRGTFAAVIQPLLERDLVGGSEIGCNDILQGGTAGLVQLPPAYEGINFFSVYRPGSDEFAGLDWGTWVIGLERIEGRYVVSFLVHFAWEI